MLSIDTETTGLWLRGGSTTFAIGLYDEKGFDHYNVLINPETRTRSSEFPRNFRTRIRDHLHSHELVFFQNTRFDLKALCECGILGWKEPCDPRFWKYIMDLGHLVHLHDSSEARGSTLKKLAGTYLEEPFLEEKELDRIVNRCRTFVRNRREDWSIASEATVPQAAPTAKWLKMDMWLPTSLLELWPSEKELQDYFKEDYPFLDKVLLQYLELDCYTTRELGSGFLTTLLSRYKESQLLTLLSMNRDLQPVLWEMETLGVTVNRRALRKAINVCEEWIDYTHERCCSLSGCDTDSFTDTQLRRILYEDYGLPVAKTTDKAGLPSVAADHLLTRKGEPDTPTGAGEFLTWYLAHQKYRTKLRYLTGYRRVTQKNLVFPSLNEAGTGTTRFSGKDPNPQNIEKAGSPFEDEDILELLEESPSLRSVFGPASGEVWVCIDYDQLQLRIFAALTEEPSMLQAFEDGHDFHTFMARVIFDLPETKTPSASQRRIAKNVNFGFIFGSGPKKIDAVAHRKGLYAYLMDCFPNVKEFMDSTKEAVQETGVVYTMGGYPLSVPLRTNPWTGGLSYAAHVAVNYRIQGTEGEIVKSAMVSSHNYLKSSRDDFDARGRIILVVHDEIDFTFDSLPDKEQVSSLCSLMEEAGAAVGVKTPVTPELCTLNFAEKEPFDVQ